MVNGEHEVLVESEAQIIDMVGTRKLPLVVPVKLRCSYNETAADSCIVQVSMPRGFKSITQLWGRAKRPKTKHVQEEKEVVEPEGKACVEPEGKAPEPQEESALIEQVSSHWVCAVCTFRHESSMADYLTCHMCQTNRHP